MKIRFSDGYSKAFEYDNIYTPELLKKAAMKGMQETRGGQYFLHVCYKDEWITVKCTENGKDLELYLCEGVYMHPYEAFNDCQGTLAKCESIDALISNLGGAVKAEWGGAREGAGRPSTGRKKHQYYVTDEEDQKLRACLEELRNKQAD